MPRVQYGTTHHVVECLAPKVLIKGTEPIQPFFPLNSTRELMHLSMLQTLCEESFTHS